MAEFQINFDGLMVGDMVSMSPFGQFASAPREFKILAVGTDKRKENSRWIAPVTHEKLKDSDKLYEREGWRIQLLKH